MNIWLDGYKTYIAGFALILLGLVDMFVMDAVQADGMTLVLNGLGFLGLRRAVKTESL